MERNATCQTAQERIAEALQTETESLAIQGCRLRQLPTEIGQLFKLTQLNLSYNQLTQLPVEIGHLHNLTLLELGENQFSQFPLEIVELQNLTVLYFRNNRLTHLPAEIVHLEKLSVVTLHGNQFSQLPPEIAYLKNLVMLNLHDNQLTEISADIAKLQKLKDLSLGRNHLTQLPMEIGQLKNLRNLSLDNNQLTELPVEIAQLTNLESLNLNGNPLNPNLAEAYNEGIEAVFTYLRAQAEASITLNEAKLILVGEGKVGKSSLLGALRGDPWVEGRLTTHGIEIKSVHITHQNTEITLNAWDFGGQDVYRPTHQLFFSAPAIYLVVWKPREGKKQGFVKEWITLITRREPAAKILIVATHRAPGQRQPDIDRQELIDEFGSDTIIDFFHVDSKPNETTQQPTDITELRDKITQIAATLPGMGTLFPAKWERARQAVLQSDQPYMTYDQVIQTFKSYEISTEQAELLLKISHTRLTHYHQDTILGGIVILKPDWLAKAISFVLDDGATRKRNGLADFNHLSQIWSNPPYEDETGYAKELHLIFLRLMERFDLSYKVILDPSIPPTTSLIAQLVPDNRPDDKLSIAWPNHPESGDRQQTQICRIVDVRGNSAPAEGLFYQLIVRLHKYSLGRDNYNDSIHWQRGMILDNDYNGRAFLEHSGTDIRITVRAAYPERFLAQLTGEVKWLIENFWKGLKCNIMVPCIEPCGQNDPGCGLFDVQKLIESKKKNRNDYPCDRCDEWQSIDQLLNNAPIAQAQMISPIEIKQDLQQIKQQLTQGFTTVSDQLDNNQRMLLSRIDAQFDTFMRMTIDEAKDGPRLFSFKPLDPKFLDKPGWMSAKFQITLWCEHSRLPLPMLNPSHPKKGVYEIEIPKEWLVKSAPWLKILSTTLGLVLPIASSAIKLELDDSTYKIFEEQLDFGQKTLELTTKASDLALNPKTKDDNPNWQSGDAILAKGSMLRQLHHLIKQKDPSFGGLEPVRNNRNEVLWVHAQFMDEY
jgi:Leucine-rich repeat (LRR) protein